MDKSDTAVLDAWDNLHNAIQRITVAQPSQMTEAANRLDLERQAFTAVLQAAFAPKRAAAPPIQEGE